MQRFIFATAALLMLSSTWIQAEEQKPKLGGEYDGPLMDNGFGFIPDIEKSEKQADESCHPFDDYCRSLKNDTLNASQHLTKEEQEQEYKRLHPPPVKDSISSLTWPVLGPVLIEFGQGIDGQRSPGIDIGTRSGTPVFAAKGGAVIYAGSGLKDLGNTILIRHPDGMVTVYGNLLTLKAKRGDRILRGQIIALSGKVSEQCDALHFEVRINATATDPMSLLANKPRPKVTDLSMKGCLERLQEASKVASTTTEKAHTAGDDLDASSEPAADETGIGLLRWPVRGRILSKEAGTEMAARKGIFVAVPAETPIKAAENGRVIFAGLLNKQLGTTIIIRHDDDLASIYANTSELYVKVGARVTRGQQIGLTGNDTNGAAIFYFEIRQNGAAVDPLNFLSRP